MPSSEMLLCELTWEDLLVQVCKILEKDEMRIKENANFYSKLYQNKNTNPEQLKKMYHRLQNDQTRLELFSELTRRLESLNAMTIVSALDQYEQSEKNINGTIPPNFSLFIWKESGKITTGYLPFK